MKISALLVPALVAVLALSACGEAPESGDAATDTTEESETAPIDQAGEAMQMIGNQMEAMQQQLESAQQQLQETQEDIATMTDAEKQAVVERAREAAENAARATGFSDEMVTQAGDAAEAAAKQTFGVE